MQHCSMPVLAWSANLVLVQSASAQYDLAAVTIAMYVTCCRAPEVQFDQLRGCFQHMKTLAMHGNAQVHLQDEGTAGAHSSGG